MLLLAAVAALASCRSLTAPPGFTSGGNGTAGRIEFPDGVSQEAQYALLTWYCEEHGAIAERQAAEAYGVALNARNERAALLRGNAVCSLASRYPGFAYVPPQGGIGFRCNLLGTRADFKEMDAMLAACQEAICAPCSVKVPVEECVHFLSSYADAQEMALFQVWAARNARLVLAVHEEGAPKDLRLCREALSLKAEILEGMSSARALFQTGEDDVEGLDVLDAIAFRIGTTRNLNAIGDYGTISDFEKYHAAAPGNCVRCLLSGWSGNADGLEDFEGRLSASLAVWESDSRLREVLRQEESHLQGTVESMLECRLAIIAQDCSDAASSGDFWRWIAWANGRMAILCSKDAGDWGCYVRQNLSGRLISALEDAVARITPAAVAFYRKAQLDAATITDRQVVVIALDEMLAQLEEREAEAAPTEICVAALNRLSRQEAFCCLGLEDFSSEVTSVSGEVLTKDLMQALEQLLFASHAEGYLALTADLPSSDYLLSAGEILEFTGGEVETHTRTERHRWYDEARLEERPEDIGFAQALWEEEISVQTLVRVGHVRIQGELHGNGRVAPFVFEDDCPMEFVQEKVLSTQVIQTTHCEDERELQTVGVPRKLRQERVWSAAEMMDFCRQRFLKILPERILCQILDIQYATASSETDLMERAEELGRMLYALQKCAFPEGSAIEKKRQGYLAVLPGEVRQAVVVGLVKSGSAL